MTITAADLKFFAAEYPLDTSYGGGRRGGYAITTGSENNVFPDVPVSFRSTGGVQFRKVYPSVISANADPLMQASVIVSAGSADSAQGLTLFAAGDQSTTRAGIYASSGIYPYTQEATGITAAGVPGSANQLSFPTASAPALGVKYYVTGPGFIVKYAHGISSAVSGSNTIVTFSANVSRTSALSTDGYALYLARPSAELKYYGIAVSTATSTTSGISINRVEAQIVPLLSVYPTKIDGLPDNQVYIFSQTDGKVPIFRAGDSVVIVGGGNSEAAVVAAVDYRGALTFASPLTYSYASGAKVSGAASLGDLQALVGPSFSQQTWTRAFSDALIGNPITANYNRMAGVITTSNLGAITERWAVIFTSATAFRLVGERLGQIATGSTAAAFAPTNPATSAAYFSIPTAGWGSGWGIGNVLRFNTTGAYAPLWAARTVSPSAAGGVDGSTLQLRGSVDA